MSREARLLFLAVFMTGAVVGPLVAMFLPLSSWQQSQPGQPTPSIWNRSPEITAQQYRHVHHLLDADSDLRPDVAAAMEDGLITRDEFDAIELQAEPLQLLWLRSKPQRSLEKTP